MSTLVIIDMQTGFSSSQNPRVVAACKRELREAVSCGNRVVIVELWHPGSHYYGKTLPELMAVVEGYENAVVVVKDRDDGSSEILDATDGDECLRICDVNGEACVRSTVSGLAGERKMVLVEDAINCYTVGQEDTPEGLMRLRRCLMSLEDETVTVEIGHPALELSYTGW